MSYRNPLTTAPMRAAGVPVWYAPGDIRAMRGLRASRGLKGLGAIAASRSLIYYPRPSRPGVWYAPGDIRAVKAMRAMHGLGAIGARNVPRWYAPGDSRATRGVKALRGLLGLGTDIMPDQPAASVVTDPGQNVQSSSTPNVIAPTQAPDGSMAPTPLVPAPAPVATVPVPVAVPMPVSSAPKKWYSFLETTKADGTVTGPLGLSWTAWLVGAGAGVLFFASRNSGGGESTPNKRGRRRRNKRKARRNARRRR